GRALVAYVLVPLPWQIHSTDAVLYIPEQMIWYALLVMAPIGVLAGLRRDPTVTMMLAAYAGASALAVGLGSGNIGTLIRHRGITITYVVWLSALGACELLRGMVRLRQTSAAINLLDPSPERSLHALD